MIGQLRIHIKLSIVIFFFSCNNFSNSKSNGDNINSISSHYGVTNLDSLYEIFYQQLNTKLGFKIKNSNDDDTLIRIWVDFGLSEKGRVVQLKEENSSWSFLAYYYDMKFDEDQSLISARKLEERKFNFTFWDSFKIKLKSYNFFELKDFSDIPSYSLGTGGTVLRVEFIINNNYSHLKFPSFEVNESDVVDVQNLLSVIYLIYREYNYDMFEGSNNGY